LNFVRFPSETLPGGVSNCLMLYCVTIINGN
jgi:hypothetical protein